jgi:hypothetical protein
MKKTVILLLALIFAAPAMAQDVDFDVNSLGSFIIAIDYNANAAPNDVSAFALKVSVDSGTTIVAVTDFHVGESNSTAKGYGIFPCNIDINETTGNVNQYGTPVAPNTAPDASGTGLDTNSVILELGALYEDGNQPPRTGRLCKLEISAPCGTSDCNVTIAANATRGNVVMDTAAEATTNLPHTENATLCTFLDATYGIDRRYADITDHTQTGPPDCSIDWADLSYPLVFWNVYMANCGTTSYPALCPYSDITDHTQTGPPDGICNWADLSPILIFWGQNTCD